ncbi:MAG: aspartate 4-decarboxylase [Cellulosilyticaceae bacterium]
MFHLTKQQLKKIYDQVSPFEFKEELIALAKRADAARPVLDAGRGNPNWTAALPRQAFFALGQFAVEETQRTWAEYDLAGMPTKAGIAERLDAYLEAHQDVPGIELIRGFVAFGITKHGFDPDCWVYELVDGIIGDNYPFPDRFLVHIEKIALDYLKQELCGDVMHPGEFDVFGVEGGAAGMCYLFDSLVQNRLLHKGDKIALMTPIFTPYLEIPHLPDYAFDVVEIHASERDEEGNPTWQYPDEELDKLKDPEIKVVFVVNPNNPISIAMSERCKSHLVDLVKNYRQDLMIVTDDVYGTFVDDFSSLIVDLPYHTLCVYSLSKYFGVTGWRLGTLMLQQENIFNELIAKLPKEDKDAVNQRYQHLCSTPEEVSFIDRIVADSRAVALNHTAGLSTPQQVQMALFCGFALLDEGNRYKEQTKTICKKRKARLMKGLELSDMYNPLDASYYTEINILDWATKKYGTAFAKYLQKEYSTLDFLYDLAKDHGVVLLPGEGFASSKWGVRVSLANLNDDEYELIGNGLRQVLEHWAYEWRRHHAYKIKRTS